jgi:hypothetical protein
MPDHEFHFDAEVSFVRHWCFFSRIFVFFIVTVAINACKAGFNKVITIMIVQGIL